MNRQPSQPELLPSGLSEDEVLAWIECELSNNRHEAVGRVIDGDPALAKRLKAMRADREAVRAMPIVRAPEGLIETVEATMERQALLGLADGVELSGSPPISVVRTARRPIGDVFSLRSTPVRLAAAAGLLLAIGAAAYTGIWALNRPSLNPGGPVASGGPDESRAETDVPGAAVETVATNSDDESTQPPFVEESIHLAWMQSPNPFEFIDADRVEMAEALRLAAEGRLVIEVTSGNVRRALRDLGELAVLADSGSDQWRLTSDVPTRVAMALSPGEPEMGPIAVADRQRENARPPLDIDRPAQTGVYLADARLTARSLGELLSAMDADGRVAEFVALDEPIELGERPVSFDEIIWWTSSPTDWAMWTRVPVVFGPER